MGTAPAAGMAVSTKKTRRRKRGSARSQGRLSYQVLSILHHRTRGSRVLREIDLSPSQKARGQRLSLQWLLAICVRVRGRADARSGDYATFAFIASCSRLRFVAVSQNARATPSGPLFSHTT